jgi:hypothetical protein
MSRIAELKKQYPELNLSFFDIITRIDKSGTYKYSPLLCKIFSNRWSDRFFDLNYDSEIISGLENLGISNENLNLRASRILFYLFDFYNKPDIQTINEFMDYMDRGLIEKKDVSEYSNIDDINNSLSIAKLKEINKSLETQIIKEYENDTWIILRPLTFEASCKYGSSTRWCTTYRENPEHFFRYNEDGVLVYFINKKTGYKFAGFKGVNKSREFSFWSASDDRQDFLQLEIDDNIIPVIRKVMMSNETNRSLMPIELLEKEKRSIKSGNFISNDDILLDDLNDYGEIVDSQPRVIPMYQNTTSLIEDYFIPVRSKKMSMLDRFKSFIANIL